MGLGQTDRIRAGSTTFENGMLGLSSQNDTTTNATTNFIRTPDGTLIAQRTAGVSQYYLTDNQGSVIALVDTTGDNRTAGYAYDPYGNTRASTGPAAATNPLRYTWWLHRPHRPHQTRGPLRYYDPNIGRFTQPDPSGQETNTYAYAGDDPINNTDPTGLCSGFLSCLRSAGYGLEGGLVLSVVVPLQAVAGGIGVAGCVVDLSTACLGGLATLLLLPVTIQGGISLLGRAANEP